MHITRANQDDHQALTTIMRASKAHWGYSAQQMQKWQDELTVSPSYLADYDVYKLQKEQSPIGFYAFTFLDATLVKLDSLFVLPSEMGKGYGKYLFNDFVGQIISKQARTITLDADPHAQGFYQHLGLVTVGQKPTSIKDRYMPIMQMDVKKAC